MGFDQWVGHYWLALVQTAALGSGLLFTGIAVMLDGRARRIGNLIQLTQQHRDLWERLYMQAELARILDPDADTVKLPVTVEEERFVIFLISFQVNGSVLCFLCRTARCRNRCIARIV